ncbi:MAG: hypothetical protein A2275_12600 [Bacteroidetes bacterium RIFOXYA12_FULL_35_11]|nr:MAG: hypothetical protein A2X01_12410 [Bacteroidetes bacterium GWF2_35_48]OFY79230.1 MAG: hypothetical protein A2275_12600 [Bacteroidetes bacterium RIFOXYA12_FULL_35_11]OFY96417.1 MAG: hypothetical protein A2309_12370 [Bacteroidetes bacterium RIFOXYB2_FULL_35_7]
MIFKYFDKVKTNIDNYSHIIENYQLNEKVYSEERGFIEGEIMFIDDSRLDFAEVKDIEINQKIKYHYHYMDTDNNMIFRYDNAKHHKDIKSFPHHKHFLNTIDESSEPEITIVLNEIENIVLKK